ncbi:hypothetical protein HZA97_05270 [Candidatus Woesearchaeota archaeon]|nr:hypothetical protein [Candidatus Woesearchaeota archaeon]
MYQITDQEFVKLVEGGVPLAELEQRLRPGNSSQVGFIGQNENLIELVHSDLQIVEKYGTTHKEIADKLTELMIKSREKKSFLNALFSKEQELLSKDYEFSPAKLLTMGAQNCPWGCNCWGQTSGYIIKKGLSDDKLLRTGIEIVMASEGKIEELENLYNTIKEINPGSHGVQAYKKMLEEVRRAQENGLLCYVAITELLPHLIEQHHFFEGKQSPYRADPELLIKALNLGK